MRPEEAFDACYRSTRDDLLHQAFLLTGDVRAASGAVRDAYVVAWHHWSKVARLEDPMEFIRPHAWRHAQRRHRGRIWHRNRGISEGDKTVLDALHKLGPHQRRLLILVDVTGLPDAVAARECALTLESAEIRLQSAREQLCFALGIPPESIRERLTAVGYTATAAAALPRTSIITRAGRQRRNRHALAFVAGVVALTVGSGVLANDPDRTRPTVQGGFLPSHSNSPSPAPATDLADTWQLLDSEAMESLLPSGLWVEQRTDGNTAGDGINAPCQSTRFADPRGVGELVRIFSAEGKVEMRAVETVETSRTETGAEAAYRTMAAWYAGCHAPRTQLGRTFAVEGIGDESLLVYLDKVTRKGDRYAVGLARVGTKSVSLVTITPVRQAPTPRALLLALRDAVARLCPEDDCVDSRPSLTAALPRIDSPSGLLAAADLPPVGSINATWVGTKASAKGEHPAALSCRLPRLGKAGADSNHNRTYLIPQADVPTSFGLAETVATFPSDRAASAYAESIADALVRCADRDLTSSLDRLDRTRGGGAEITTWFLETRVSRKVTLDFRIAIIASGDRVALVTFNPAGDADMTVRQFADLARRASDRLTQQ
jgi:DNA-directed RNA polymerase specialized sigma24 family protein